MVILETLSFSWVNDIHLRARTVIVQSRWENSSLSHGVKEDIAQGINKFNIIQLDDIMFTLQLQSLFEKNSENGMIGGFLITTHM